MSRHSQPATSRLTAVSGVIALAALLLACSPGLPPDRSIEVAVQGLYSAALSSDGRYASVGSIVHGGSLWNLDSAERRYDWNHRPDTHAEITATAFSPEGDFAVTVEVRDMVLWDARTGAAITWFAAPSEILAIDLSPGARYAVLGLVDHTAVLFDIRRGGGNLRVFEHQDRVRSVSLSADGRRLLTGSEDRTARLWDVDSGAQLQRWEHRETVRLVALAPAGDRALSVSKYDRATVWDTTTGAQIAAVPLRSTAIDRGVTFTAARFSADSSQLLTGSSDREVQLWDAFGMREIGHWTLPKREVWKPSGAAVLALAFEDSSNAYWAAASNGFVHRLKLK